MSGFVSMAERNAQALTAWCSRVPDPKDLGSSGDSRRCSCGTVFRSFNDKSCPNCRPVRGFIVTKLQFEALVSVCQYGPRTISRKALAGLHHAGFLVGDDELSRYGVAVFNLLGKVWPRPNHQSAQLTVKCIEQALTLGESCQRPYGGEV